jgi:hypothetical protein
MVRDLVTEQEPKGVPVPFTVLPNESKPKPRRQAAARPQEASNPSKYLKSLYRRTNPGIPFRQWLGTLKGADREAAEAWLRNKG